MRRSLIACVAIMFIAGCGGLGLSGPATTDGVNSHQLTSADRVGSWMAPDAAKLDLLYVSDFETNDVDAYSYPQSKLVGVLRGVLKDFVYPTGLCAASDGELFIPDSAHLTILVYAHAGTKPIRTLLDPNEYPYSCAVDPTSDNLAVVNLESTDGPGSVAIYAKGAGRRKRYAFGFIYKYYFGAYNDKGDYFVDASFSLPSQPFAFLELPKGGDKLKELTLNHTIAIGGGVAWDGKYVAVADSKDAVVYRFTIAKSKGTEVGAVSLRGGRFVTGLLVDRNALVGANFYGKSVRFWPYPAGGAPAKTIAGLGYPFGVALSRAGH